MVPAILAASLAIPGAAAPAAADSKGKSVMGITLEAPHQIYSGDTIVYGTAVKVTARVFDISSSCSPVEFSCDAPAGTVELFDKDMSLGTATLQATNERLSTAVFELAGGPLADLAAGRHEISATYTGDFDSSSDGPYTIYVAQAPCAVTISQSSPTSSAGDEVEFVGDLGSVGHRGRMWFEDPIGRLLGSSELFFGAVGRLRLSNLPIGFTDVRAVYDGDENHLGCSSTFVRHTVSTRATSTALTSTHNPSTVGDSVTFRASVSGGSSTPTGTVTFRVDGNVIGTRELWAGSASLTTGSLPAGTHVVSATYSGDGTHAASVGSLHQEVHGLRTTTALTSTPSRSTAGEAVTLTATVAPEGSAAPTGSVTFYDGGYDLATVPLGADGTATIVTDALGVGVRRLTAGYSGDATYAGSFGTLDHVVSKLATTTQLTSSANPSVAGDAVVYTASVSPVSTAGPVEFRDELGAITGCGAQPLANGFATCTVTYPTAGPHRVIATFAGSAAAEGSSSAPLEQVVRRITTTTQLTVPEATPVVGVPIEYRAAVSPSAAGGTVAFRDGDTPISGCAAVAVVSGEAACTVTWPTPGARSLTASASGDATYSPSVSPAREIVVEKAPTSLTASPARFPDRHSVTVSATSRHARTGAPVGGQRVEFTAGTKSICATVTGADGVATCSGGKTAAAALRSRATYSAVSSPTATHLGSSTTGST